jgi:hypothetical protein
MLDLCLGVIGADKAECSMFDSAHVDCELYLIDNEGRSTASIANDLLASTRCKVFGLAHPDVNFGPGATKALYDVAMAGNICGIVGVNPLLEYPLNYVRCYANPGPVYVLDDCAVFFRRGIKLTFDAETFDAWSAYVPDFCYQAHGCYIPIVVPSAKAGHTGKRFRENYQQHNIEWEVQRAKLRAKWPNKNPITT